MMSVLRESKVIYLCEDTKVTDMCLMVSKVKVTNRWTLDMINVVSQGHLNHYDQLCLVWYFQVILTQLVI